MTKHTPATIDTLERSVRYWLGGEVAKQVRSPLSNAAWYRAMKPVDDTLSPVRGTIKASLYD